MKILTVGLLIAGIASILFAAGCGGGQSGATPIEAVREVTITDCVDSSSTPWFCGPYGFLLSSPVAYKDPTPYRGQLGFFQVEEAKVASRRYIP